MYFKGSIKTIFKSHHCIAYWLKGLSFQIQQTINQFDNLLGG